MSLTYETALRLKKCGFPQRGNTGICKHDLFGFRVHRESCDCMPDDTVYIPTTDELIDELGIWFDSLHRQDKDNWLAIQIDGSEHLTYEKTSALGKTPLEALSNLYIALHEK